MSKKATLLTAVVLISAFTACVSAPDNGTQGRRGQRGADRAADLRAFEPSARQAPIKVVPGEWISRSLYENNADWFTFAPAAEGILVAETSGDTDTVLTLYRDRDLLRENDDVGTDHNAKIEYFVDSGVSYLIKAAGVRLAGAEANADGPYRFRVILEPMPEKKTRPNNTLEQAAAIALGETITDYFFAAEDANWYVVPVPGTGRLTVNTEGTLDTLLELYDKWEELIGRDDDNGFQGNAKVVADLFGASSVYCRVSAYQGATGRYRLKTKFTLPVKPDPYEKDNALSDAAEIQIGVPQERNFTDADDVDWALLRIARRGSYSIAAMAEDNYLDTLVQLFDADGALLAEDDDSGGFWNALLTTDLGPGTYYIKVSCVDKDPLESNGYTLSVSAAN